MTYWVKRIALKSGEIVTERKRLSQDERGIPRTATVSRADDELHRARRPRICGTYWVSRSNKNNLYIR